jgi:hypothetical protein
MLNAAVLNYSILNYYSILNAGVSSANRLRKCTVAMRLYYSAQRARLAYSPRKMQHQFCELSADLFSILFASQNQMQLRTVSKRFREKIENSPEFFLRLSPDGTTNASSSFFVRFKGKLSVGSRHGWDDMKGWFSSLLDAIKLGLQVDSILQMTVNSLNVMQFSSRLNEVCLTKIQTLSFTFICSVRSLSNSLTSFSRLCTVAERIELKLELLYRRPRDKLKAAIDQLRSLGEAIHVQTLAIRSVLSSRTVREAAVDCLLCLLLCFCTSVDQRRWVPKDQR